MQQRSVLRTSRQEQTIHKTIQQSAQLLRSIRDYYIFWRSKLFVCLSCVIRNKGDTYLHFARETNVHKIIIDPHEEHRRMSFIHRPERCCPDSRSAGSVGSVAQTVQEKVPWAPLF